MLVARINELKILDELYDSDESKFIAVYGRRRVGKTYLIREAYNSKIIFQHAGFYGGKMQEQLFEFNASLREFGLKNFKTPSNWLEAFELLKDLIRTSNHEKKVIFIDELSWIDTPGSDFMMALEGFWNGWCSARKDIVLVVCGSVTSWMLNKIVHNKGGLYNRLSAKIHLKPFNLSECEEYIKSRNIVMSRYQILQCYMILGGIPYYWSHLKKGLSVAQNIDEMFFTNNASLENEFEYLYTALFKHPDQYVKIIKALSLKKVGMNREELLAETKCADSGNFSTKLSELESCGFIRKYNEYGKMKKNSVYQLIDNYTLFYFKFLANRPTDEHFWSNQVNTPLLNSWSGLAFERVCLQHVRQLKMALKIEGVLTQEYSFACKRDDEVGISGSQIDLLIERKDQVINICEMKFDRREYIINKAVNDSIQNKVSDFIIKTGTSYAIHPILVTTYGVKENPYSSNVQAVITMNDLFKN